MKNENVRELFENRSNDWLSEELKYERRVSTGFDITEGQKLKQQHEEHCEAEEISTQHAIAHSQAKARSKNYTTPSRTSTKTSSKGKTSVIAAIIVVLIIVGFVVGFINMALSYIDPYGYFQYRLTDIFEGVISLAIPIIIFISIASTIRKAVKKQ